MNTPVNVKKEEKGKQIASLLEKLKPQLELALPKHLTPDRLARIVLTEFRKNERLQECTVESIAACAMLCGQMGLEVGPLGHVYLVPYGKECTFIIGYRGMLDMARRSGQITSLTAHVVRRKDKFQYAFGSEDRITHEPYLGDDDAGDIIAVYAVAKLKDGSMQLDVMTRAEVEKNRESSKNKEGVFWTKHYAEMARKTVIRRLFKYLPVSVEMQQAIAFEDRAEGANVIDVVKESNMVIPDGLLDIEEIDMDAHLSTLIADKTNEESSHVVEDFLKE